MACFPIRAYRLVSASYGQCALRTHAHPCAPAPFFQSCMCLLLRCVHTFLILASSQCVPLATNAAHTPAHTPRPGAVFSPLSLVRPPSARNGRLCHCRARTLHLSLYAHTPRQLRPPSSFFQAIHHTLCPLCVRLALALSLQQSCCERLVRACHALCDSGFASGGTIFWFSLIPTSEHATLCATCSSLVGVQFSASLLLTSPTPISAMHDAN